MQETQVWSLCWEDPLEEGTHSSVLAWEIPWTEEPGRLHSKGSRKSGTWLSDWTTTSPLLTFEEVRNPSVQFSHSVVSNSLGPQGLQHTRPPCPSPTPRVYSNSCPLSRWCHPTNSFSGIPFSSCLHSFPASRSFQPSQFFASGGQSIVVPASASVLPMNIQDWFSLGWTGCISLQFSPQLSLQPNSRIHTWLKTITLTRLYEDLKRSLEALPEKLLTKTYTLNCACIMVFHCIENVFLSQK